MKKAATVAGFVLIVVGIAALASQVPVLGIHPAAWFILGAGLLLSDAAWERLAQKQPRQEQAEHDETPENGANLQK